MISPRHIIIIWVKLEWLTEGWLNTLEYQIGFSFIFIAVREYLIIYRMYINETEFWQKILCRIRNWRKVEHQSIEWPTVCDTKG